MTDEDSDLASRLLGTILNSHPGRARWLPRVELSQERKSFNHELLLVFAARDQLVKVQLQRRACDLRFFEAVPIHQEIDG